MASRKGSSYIQLNFYGFEELLKKIEDAGGTIDKSVESCMEKSAQIQQEEMKTQMQRKKVANDLIERMPLPEIKWKGNACIARVGYKTGSYNPKNLSDGYKAVFINYGTPRIKPRSFIKAAHTKAKPKIKKQQEETLNEILGELNK